MSDDHQHALRAWTTADKYQRLLCEWAGEHGLSAGKVREVGVRYSMEGCRVCTVEDPLLTVTVAYEDMSGGLNTVHVYDDARMVRSLATLTAGLSSILEEQESRQGGDDA